MSEAINFYDLLVCPVTKQRLKLADNFLVETLNSKIGSGDLVTPFGHKIEERLSGVLVREDTQVAYPIRDGIPILLKEESIFMR
jgi:uncharacterized protein YbaR (Trm112 family)